jgi:type III pantothenate kinase
LIVALDLGNTRVKWALHPGGQPVAGRFIAEGVVAADAIDALPDAWSNVARVQAIITCSVADCAADAAVDRLAACLSVPVQRIVPVAAAAGVRNLYQQPGSLGADRWAALVAARARAPDAALVVDAGTALTVDALAADGRFLGGLIVPGYELMRSALARGTARLPVAAGRFDPFPRCTDDAIVSGALQAMAGAVTRTLDAMVAAGEAAPRLLLTGGSAPLLLAPLAAHRPCHVPSLVLEGLLVLADAAADEYHAQATPCAAAQATVASTPR